MNISHQNQTLQTLSHLLNRAWKFNALLTLAAILHVFLIPALFVGMVIDPKVITGANAWVKPLKFAISNAIYCFTFVWLLTFIQGRQRWVQGAAYATAIALIIEMAVITLQVIRGTTSHFNLSTAFDSAVYVSMGIFAVTVSLAAMIAAIILLFQRIDNRIFAWSLRLSLIISIVGMNVAFLMTSRPTPTQIAALEAGGPLTNVGAHSVGVEDGGAGLPFVGWSTTGGDLRAPHFFGIHAMQILPLLGWLLTRPNARRRFSETQRLILAWTFGLAYLGMVGLLTWQALRGQSIIAPDGLMLAATGALAGSVLLVLAGVILRSPNRLASAE